MAVALKHKKFSYQLPEDVEAYRQQKEKAQEENGPLPNPVTTFTLQPIKGRDKQKHETMLAGAFNLSGLYAEMEEKKKDLMAKGMKESEAEEKSRMSISPKMTGDALAAYNEATAMIIRKGLVGWKDFYYEDGEEVPFPDDIDEAIDILIEAQCFNSIGQAILDRGKTSKADLGN